MFILSKKNIEGNSKSDYTFEMKTYNEAFDFVIAELNSIDFWVIDGKKRENMKAYNTKYTPLIRDEISDKYLFPKGEHKFAYGDKKLIAGNYLFNIESVS